MNAQNLTVDLCLQILDLPTTLHANGVQYALLQGDEPYDLDDEVRESLDCYIANEHVGMMGGEPIAIAIVDDEVVGVISGPTDDPDEIEMCISSSTAHRRKGIARILALYASAWCCSINALLMAEPETEDGNAFSIGLSEQSGGAFAPQMCCFIEDFPGALVHGVIDELSYQQRDPVMALAHLTVPAVA